VADALLAVAGLGDLGQHFPSSDSSWAGADSMELLRQVAAMCAAVEIEFLDVTVIAQSVRVAPHRESIQDRLAEMLGVEVERVSVKATTTDGMGSIGADEGLAAVAVITARA
jgi:2-C-methyl-D-erythritol 2,4-cyclodiphosphate synthase